MATVFAAEIRNRSNSADDQKGTGDQNVASVELQLQIDDRDLNFFENA
jgi:hypothetical protein